MPNVNMLLFLGIAINIAILSSVLIYYHTSNKDPSSTRETTMSVSDTNLNSSVLEKHSSVRLELKISNFGSSRKTKNLVLKSNGKILGSRDVSLNPNERKTVKFNLQGLDVGTHNVEVGGIESSFKVVESGNCPPPEVSVNPMKNVGKLSVTHTSGSTIENIINQFGNLGNLSVTKNGTAINGPVDIKGDNDTDWEPGEKIEIKDNNLNAGDQIEIKNPETDNILKEMIVPFDTGFSKISQTELPKDFPNSSLDISHFLKSNSNKSQVKNTSFNFKVDKSWLSKNNVNENEVSVRGYNQEKESWESNPVEKVDEDDNHLYFESSTQNAKYFAITESGNLKTNSSSQNKYFSLIITTITIFVIVMEVKVLLDWTNGKQEIKRILRDGKDQSRELKLRSEDFKRVINEFVSSGKRRAMIKTSLPTEKVLEYSKSAIKSLKMEENIRAEIVNDRVHLVRKID